ncbi:MAG: SUMF1/EgtB/PvdO family nonheme iron enzyme [Hyphomonadaceae bacterium]|nr:SUMF1/EgtB/PvdO family nonheme iron enzyme [Hyphomonadaceae bacterium]
MPDVFVSYNREDLPIAQRVVDGLVHEGLNVWLDMELKAGENYDEITEERLRGAKAVVVLWSSRSVKSRWVRAEATIGQRKSTLVPAMIEECDRPVMFELVQTTDLSKWEGDRADPNWRKLVGVIRDRIAAAPPGPLFAEGGVKKQAGKGAKRKAAPKQVAIRKEHVVKKRGMGVGGVLVSMFALLAVAAAGIYVWRPQQVNELLASLSNQASTVATDVASLRAAGADTPAPTLTATASPEALVDAAPVDHPATPEPAAPLAETTPAAAPANTFRECDACPLMLNVQGGTFMMGAPDDELGRKAWEGPQRKVAMAPFTMGVSEVSYDEWDACVADSGCGKYTPKDAGARGKLPVTQVSWKDAVAYAAWLTKKTGRAYRLPTEAEWEYAGRGGTTTPFWWGAMNDVAKSGSGAATQAVDTLAANPLGLLGVTGNVREWTQDCYVNTFAKAPLDGRSVEVAKCAQRVLRGGSFNDGVEALRIAARARNAPDFRDRLTGFRVAAAP